MMEEGREAKWQGEQKQKERCRGGGGKHDDEEGRCHSVAVRRCTVGNNGGDEIQVKQRRRNGTVLRLCKVV